MKLKWSEVEERARAAGAVAVGAVCLDGVQGVVTAGVMARYVRWLREGKHGQMHYLARHLHIRRDPRLLLAPPKSVQTSRRRLMPQQGGVIEGGELCANGTLVSMAFPYCGGEVEWGGDLRVARYALGEDYHDVIRRRLRPLARWIKEVTGQPARVCVDTAPVMERYWAERAGVGRVGMNGQLLVPGYGASVFLAEIVTAAGVEGIPAAEEKRGVEEICVRCGRCVRACPGGALTAEGVRGYLDARRCHSYLSIEYRGEELPVRLVPGMAYGCDVCADVCPAGKRVTKGESPNGVCLPEFAPREQATGLTREGVMGMDEKEWEALTSGSAMRRVTLAQMQRNVR